MKLEEKDRQRIRRGLNTARESACDRPLPGICIYTQLSLLPRSSPDEEVIFFASQYVIPASGGLKSRLSAWKSAKSRLVHQGVLPLRGQVWRSNLLIEGGNRIF